VKQRLFFVSNSSSSSFIVASKEKPVLKVTIDIGYLCDDQIQSLEELEDHVRHHRNYGQPLEEILKDEYERNFYNKCKQALEEGNTLYLGDVSSDGYDDQPYVYYHGLECGETNYTVIQGAG
jgi:hypothetical protein